MSTTRIHPETPPCDAELAVELEKWMPPGVPVNPLVLFRTLGRNLPLTQAMRGVGSYMLGRRSSVGLREHLIAFVCNGAELELEDWAMRFPDASAGQSGMGG